MTGVVRMTAFLKKIFFFSLLVLGLLGADCDLAQAKKILIGATSYWNPYSYISTGDPDEVKGFSVEIVRRILEDEGSEPIFMILPWKRCLRMLELKQLDLVLDGSMSPERLDKFIFSDEMYRVEHVFFYSKRKFPKGPTIQNISDVGNYSLGGLAGFNFEVYPFDVSRVQDGAADYKGLLAMLQFGRFDLAVALKQIVMAHAKMNALDMSEFGMVDIPAMNSIPFYILGANTPSGRILISRINKGLEKLRKSGEYNTCLIKYGIENVQ